MMSRFSVQKLGTGVFASVFESQWKREPVKKAAPPMGQGLFRDAIFGPRPVQVVKPTAGSIRPVPARTRAVSASSRIQKSVSAVVGVSGPVGGFILRK
jgi:hypothetical protein